MRWLGFGVFAFVFGATAIGCGSSVVVESAEADTGVLAVEPGTPAPQQAAATAAPTPSPTPSSRAAPLQPSIWAVPPMLREGRPVPAADASAVLVMDEASGAVLWEQNGDVRRAPASLTKIATAVVALQAGDLGRDVVVDVDSKAMPSSSVMGLMPGDRFTLEDLLYGLMLPSGNDAALAIARAVSEYDAAFVHEMNALIERLGLRETHFSNPHGLSASNHYTSAYDLAVLARYAMSIDGFPELVAARSYTATGSREISMRNSNALVSSYPGADGMKVGYTRSAGHTLVASATRDGHRVYVVLLNAPNSQADAQKLLNWAFTSHAWPPP